MSHGATKNPIWLIDQSGVPMAVLDGVVVPASTSALLMAGVDAGGLARVPRLDASGRYLVLTSTPNPNIAFGDVTTSGTTQVPVNRNAYTEQAANTQWNVISTSALDTGAGTGAQQLTLIYYDSAGAGPKTTVVTLSGLTQSLTAVSDLCFLEEAYVTRAGALNANQGILSIRTGSTVITTMAAGENQTFLAHHYVAAGLTCSVTGISGGGNATVVGGGALFTLKQKQIGVTGAVEVQHLESLRLYGQSSSVSRLYLSAVKITGPARLALYVTPETSTAVSYRGGFDLNEE